MAFVPQRVLTRGAGLAVVLIWSSCFVATRGTAGTVPSLLYAVLGVRPRRVTYLGVVVSAGASWAWCRP